MQGIAHQPRFIQCCNAVGGVAALTAVVVPILLHKQRSSVELCAEQLKLLKGNEALSNNNESVSNSFHNPKLVFDVIPALRRKNPLKKKSFRYRISENQLIDMFFEGAAEPAHTRVVVRMNRLYDVGSRTAQAQVKHYSGTAGRAQNCVDERDPFYAHAFVLFRNLMSGLRQETAQKKTT